MWVFMNHNLDAREKRRAVLDVRRGPFPPWGKNGKQIDNRDKSIELRLMSHGRPMLSLTWSPGYSVRAGVNRARRLFPAAQHTRQHPFRNAFNSIIEFRLAVTLLPSHYPEAFLLLIPAQDVRSSSLPSCAPPSSHHWLISYPVASTLQGRHSPGLTHSVPFLHRHPLTADHKGPD